MKVGEFMKKITCVLLATLLLMLVGGCSSELNNSTSETVELSRVETESTEPSDYSAETTIKTNDFGDRLDEFQGEWESETGHRKVIISGNTVNYIHYDFKNEDKVSKVFTFYFALDENDKLVVQNQYHQTRAILLIDDNGTLIKKDSYTGEEEDKYKKISDNTEVPSVSPEPYVGMTSFEVYSSTWGAPKKINKTTTVNGVSEQWVYDYGYIYIINGYVTAIQER